MKTPDCWACGYEYAVPTTLLNVYYAFLCQDCRNNFQSFCQITKAPNEHQDLALELEVATRHLVDTRIHKHIRQQLREAEAIRIQVCIDWLDFQQTLSLLEDDMPYEKPRY